ncbi:hypothetical protein PROFUN_02828 [Planoprotostelium fungivorum]|uniref:Uncharacterized protein n=1 Tax=Planoprotostelium fungivorum TaxID=1890364 RepID=A0A2P6NXQ5_9EUKA|nr:hypothetical protein PROFUN_02828 [Planoprotostelium fungivorum]
MKLLAIFLLSALCLAAAKNDLDQEDIDSIRLQVTERQYQYNHAFDDAIKICTCKGASSAACTAAISATVSVFCDQRNFVSWQAPPSLPQIPDLNVVKSTYGFLSTALFTGFSVHEVTSPVVNVYQLGDNVFANFTARVTQTARQFSQPGNTSSPIVFGRSTAYYNMYQVTSTRGQRQVCMKRFVSAVDVLYLLKEDPPAYQCDATADNHFE